MSDTGYLHWLRQFCIIRVAHCGNLFTAGWSSQVARRAHNPEVVGSNPTPATNLAA
jgi:hypothetical protein